MGHEGGLLPLPFNVGVNGDGLHFEGGGAWPAFSMPFASFCLPAACRHVSFASQTTGSGYSAPERAFALEYSPPLWGGAPTVLF